MPEINLPHKVVRYDFLSAAADQFGHVEARILQKLEQFYLLFDDRSCEVAIRGIDLFDDDMVRSAACLEDIALLHFKTACIDEGRAAHLCAFEDHAHERRSAVCGLRVAGVDAYNYFFNIIFQHII